MAVFPSGKGGGELVDYGYKGKGVTIHSLVDANGYPLAISTTPANGDERKEVEILLQQLPRLPHALYADKGYDAQWLRELLLEKYAVTSHIPKRSWTKNKPKQTPTQNKRYVVERTFSWYQRKFRRINIKWERKKSPWNAFLNFAIIYYWINILVG
jgi:transposase